VRTNNEPLIGCQRPNWTNTGYDFLIEITVSNQRVILIACKKSNDISDSWRADTARMLGGGDSSSLYLQLGRQLRNRGYIP
jgi:hypothetical protein